MTMVKQISIFLILVCTSVSDGLTEPLTMEEINNLPNKYSGEYEPYDREAKEVPNTVLVGAEEVENFEIYKGTEQIHRFVGRYAVDRATNIDEAIELFIEKYHKNLGVNLADEKMKPFGKKWGYSYYQKVDGSPVYRGQMSIYAESPNIIIGISNEFYPLDSNERVKWTMTYEDVKKFARKMLCGEGVCDDSNSFVSIHKKYLIPIDNTGKFVEMWRVSLGRTFEDGKERAWRFSIDDNKQSIVALDEVSTEPIF